MKSRFAILALVLAQFGITAWGAEDPRRFLAVESWRGTFGQDMSVVGSKTYQQSTGGECTVDYSHVHHINPSNIILSNAFGFGSLKFWLSDGVRIPNAGTITERLTLTCPENQTHRADGNAVQGYFQLQIDAAANQSVIQFPLIYATITAITPDGTFVGPELGNAWGPPVTNTLPATGLALNGLATITLDQFGQAIFVPVALEPADVQEVLRSSTLVVTWNLEPIVEEIEVVVQPEGYKEWTPEGNLNQPEQRGNSIEVSARLQKKGGGVPAERATRFDFELVNVSAEPGLCMNFPIQSPSTEPDLKFEAELNPPSASGGDTVIVGDDVVGVFANLQGMLTGHTVVSSFDFGAYGEIQVTAYVSGRDPIVGYLKDDPQKRKNVPLPKCQPGSHIADIWKERWGVSNLADEADDEDFPEGDEHPGDGYTLYEEYRGFCENRDHVRLIPLRKELFIRNEIEDGRVVAEIVKFKTASSLGVHYKLRDDEITPVGLMNVNHGHAYSGHPQSGIVLNLRPEEKGYSEAVGAAGALGNSTPGSKLRVEIEPAGPGWGLDLNTGQELYHTFLASIAHEIAHCCGVWHHGDCDPKKRVWWLNPLDNQNYESAPESSISDSVAIQPIDERGRPVTIPDFPGSLDVHLAVPQGQHSGDVNCFMCYRVATALRRDNSSTRIYLGSLDFPPRSLFCTSAQATGMNAPPRNLFGNAHAPERGNCAGQICVNDKYKDDEKHDRKYSCP